MAGAHIEREARYAQTGLSSPQRDQLIIELRAKGWTLTKIGNHLGMTPAGVMYACQRLAGIPRRKQVKRDMCDGCWEDVPTSDLDPDGLCSACRSTDGS